VLLGADLSGRYKGEFRSTTSSWSGKIQLTVKPGSDAVQASNVVFTLAGSELKTKIRSLRIDGNQLEISYEFVYDGLPLVSTLKGKLQGDKLEGTYQTSYAGRDEQADEGKFETMQVK
jgi:hypothetical protein